MIRLHLIRNHGKVDDAAAAALAERFDQPTDPTRRNAELKQMNRCGVSRLDLLYFRCTDLSPELLFEVHAELA